MASISELNIGIEGFHNLKDKTRIQTKLKNRKIKSSLSIGTKTTHIVVGESCSLSSYKQSQVDKYNIKVINEQELDELLGGFENSIPPVQSSLPDEDARDAPQVVREKVPYTSSILQEFTNSLSRDNGLELKTTYVHVKKIKSTKPIVKVDNVNWLDTPSSFDNVVDTFTTYYADEYTSVSNLNTDNTTIPSESNSDSTKGADRVVDGISGVTEKWVEYDAPRDFFPSRMHPHINDSQSISFPSYNTMGHLWTWKIESNKWESLIPTPNLNLSKEWISYVTSGPHHVIAITALGELWSYGRCKGIGQGDSVKSTKTFKRIEKMVGHVVTHVACGLEHSVAVTEENRVFSWGTPSGHKEPTDDYSLPREIEIDSSYKVVFVACGLSHTALLCEDGKLLMYGGNDHGQLGFGNTKDELIPKLLDHINKPIIWVAAGGSQTKCVTIDGEVYSWGEFAGHGTSADVTLPKLLMNVNIKNFNLSCGDSHTIISTDDNIYSFGSSHNGYLGYESPHDILEPKLIDLPKELKNNVYKIICKGNLSTFITKNNSLWITGKGKLFRKIEQLDGSIYHITNTTNTMVAVLAGWKELAVLYSKRQGTDGFALLLPSLPKYSKFPYCSDSSAMTPMHWACQYGNIELINLLLEYKFNLNVQNDKKENPLHIYIRTKVNDNNLLLRLLSESSSEAINGTDFNGDTILHIAVRCRNNFIVEKLVEMKLNLDVQNNNKETPLHIAIQNGYRSIALHLITMGASIYCSDIKGFTPILYSHGEEDTKFYESIAQKRNVFLLFDDSDRVRASQLAQLLRSQNIFCVFYDWKTDVDYSWSKAGITLCLVTETSNELPILQKQFKFIQNYKTTVVVEMESSSFTLSESFTSTSKKNIIKCRNFDENEVNVISKRLKSLVQKAMMASDTTTSLFENIPTEILSINEQDINKDARVVKVFVSSTFRDMMDERNYMMTHTIHQLNRIAHERNVTFSFVDLKWGITEEMSSSGQVIETCLKEVEDCCPYFIGILGERYGWHQTDFNHENPVHDELLEKTFNNAIDNGYTWLEEYRDRSVTELEIIHGVLNRNHNHKHENNKITPRAFFYFRDSSFMLKLDFETEGIYLSESDHAKQKLTQLKQSILHHKNAIVKDYSTAQELGDLIFKDFSETIRRDFPPIENNEVNLSIHEIESKVHNSFAQSNQLVYLRRFEYDAMVHDYINNSNPLPLIVTGEPGIGKTTCMSNWSQLYKKMNPSAFVWYHFIGASTESTKYTSIIRRLMNDCKNYFKLDLEIPVEDDTIVPEFHSLLRYLGENFPSSKILLIIDSMDQLEDYQSSRDLHWIPNTFPTNLRVVLSINSNETVMMRVANARRWPLLTLPPFIEKEKRSVLNLILKKHSKKLNNEHINSLVNSENTENPLFLKTLVEELCVVGKFETLTLQIRSYLRCTNFSELLNKVIDRWESDYHYNKIYIIKDILSLISVSRNGVSETEIIEILNIPRAYWSSYYTIIKPILINRSGLFKFGHSQISNAIEHRYSGMAIQSLKLLSTYFLNQEMITDRKLFELPWLLYKSKDYVTLIKVLSNLAIFCAIYNEETKFEIMKYWKDSMRGTGRGETFYHMIDCYKESIRIYELSHPTADKLARRLYLVAELCREFAQYNEAEDLYRRAINTQETLFELKYQELYIQQQNARDMAETLEGLAWMYYRLTKYNDAEWCAKYGIQIIEKYYGSDSFLLVELLCSLSNVYSKKALLDDAEMVAMRALNITERTKGPNHYECARSVNLLCVVYKKKRQFEKAEVAGIRALEIREKSLGNTHLLVSQTCNNLANIYNRLGDLKRAKELYERAAIIVDELLGKHHPDYAQNRYNIGNLLLRNELNEEAMLYYEMALSIALKVYNYGHVFIHKIIVHIQRALKIEDNDIFNICKKGITNINSIGVQTGLMKIENGKIESVDVDKPKIKIPEIVPIQLYTVPKNLFTAVTPSIAIQNAVTEESSDEDFAEECAESSDEDMGFGLFD